MSYTLKNDPDLAPDLRADLACSEREAAEDERFRTPYRRDLRASIARTEPPTTCKAFTLWPENSADPERVDCGLPPDHLGRHVGPGLSWRVNRLSDPQFHSLLAVLMCSDRGPGEKEEAPAVALLDTEARLRGYDGWLDAYRKQAPGYVP